VSPWREAVNDEVGASFGAFHYIGKAAKATFHLLEAGHLPARKIGGRWCASRRKLLEALIGDDGDRLSKREAA
jgi:hypothetical protein